jgi:hypothetical protein
MWNGPIPVPAVPIPAPLPALPLTPPGAQALLPLGAEEPLPLAGRHIAVVGAPKQSMAIAAELTDRGAVTSIHPPGHPLGGAGAPGPRSLDGVVIVLTPANARIAPGTVAGVMRRAPSWTLVLGARTLPAEAADAVVRLSSQKPPR